MFSTELQWPRVKTATLTCFFLSTFNRLQPGNIRFFSTENILDSISIEYDDFCEL